MFLADKGAAGGSSPDAAYLTTLRVAVLQSLARAREAKSEQLLQACRAGNCCRRGLGFTRTKPKALAEAKELAACFSS